MKKIYILAAMIAACVTANAFESYSFISLTDSIIRINPAQRGKVIEVEATAHFCDAYDSWDVNLVYPQGLECLSIYQLPGTYISYFDAAGDVQPYIVPLHVSNDKCTVICESFLTTYWLVDGRWKPYGYARWAPGDHRMFTLVLYVDPEFEEGQITLSTIMRMRPDRHTEYTTESYCETQFIVCYDTGDVNGDGEVNISDINAIIDIVLCGDDNSDGRADVNSDGEVNINDVTALINEIL